MTNIVRCFAFSAAKITAYGKADFAVGFFKLTHAEIITPEFILAGFRLLGVKSKISAEMHSFLCCFKRRLNRTMYKLYAAGARYTH